MHDARRLELERAVLGGLDRLAAVDCDAERVDDAPHELLADGDADDSAGALHRVALADALPVAEERDADVVLLEVEGDAGDVGPEVEHLAGDTVLEPVDAGDAVADLEHGADLGEIGLDVGLRNPLLQDRGDLFRA